MANITPGIIHYEGFYGIACGVEYTSDWDDDDAEVTTTNDIFQVTCKNCLEQNLQKPFNEQP